jgi:undecaprenyl-diphosphatase
LKEAVVRDLIIFLAKYLVYLLAAWTVVTGWYLRKDSSRSFIFWSIKLGLVLLIVTLIDLAINHVYPTSRPFVVEGIEPLIPHQADPSFPSTHAANAAVLATFIWRLHRGWGILAWVLAVLVGVGRVAAQLHYPVDVVGGLVIGFVVSYLVLRLWPRSWE